MTVPESNIIASRNGREMEKAVLLYMGLEHIGQPVDSSLEGIPLEVKSCQIRIGDNSHSNNCRSGRIVFESEQLKYLKANDGILVCIVHEDYVVHHSWMMKAELVQLQEFGGNRSVPWPTVRGWLNG